MPEKFDDAEIRSRRLVPVVLIRPSRSGSRIMGHAEHLEDGNEWSANFGELNGATA